MKGKKLKIFRCGNTGGGTLPALPFITSDAFGLSAGVFGGAYVFNSVELEQNQPPVCKDVQVTGTLGTGNNLTVTATIQNNSIYSLNGCSCLVYRASDLVGSFATLVTTITNNTNVFTYTQVLADEGKYLSFYVIPKVSGGNNATGDGYSSQFTDKVPATPNALDVFNVLDFRGWLLADTAALTSWANNANPSAPATNDTNAPSVTKGEVKFLGSASQAMLVPHPAMSEPFVQYKIIRPTVLNATQTIDALTSGSVMRFQSNRHLFINNVDTGVIYPNDSTKPYLVKVTNNGASSLLQIGTYTEPGGVPTLTLDAGTTFNDGTPAIGTGTGKFGTAGTSFYYTGGMLYYGAKSSALSGPQETAALTELAQRIYNWTH